MACRDMSQIEELLVMIKKHRDARVTGVSVMYTWLGRRIQPLQKRTCFGFVYLGISDPSQFSVERIEKGEALLRVSRVLMGAEIIPYVPSLYSVKNPPKQDDVNLYRSMPLMPDIYRPSHLMPSTRPLAIAATSEEEKGDETDDDRPLSEVIKGKSIKTSQEGASSPGGAFFPDHPKGPRAATRKRKASASPGSAEEEIPRVEDATGDDTVREKSVASVTVDPSSGSAGAASGLSRPVAGLSSFVTITVASSGKHHPWLA
ncbi:hypothetical protein C2845_PM16G04080 [Panicum miliaceum]|uniref:Uncharacterized protein n=1 Tax=Panicum miliaceum TaxID=4540 RepID=A0A3L6PXV2_PANMI|nr:hypothetical protein C2845_PM16G04080 [Panicum miliaceum]